MSDRIRIIHIIIIYVIVDPINSYRNLLYFRFIIKKNFVRLWNDEYE